MSQIKKRLGGWGLAQALTALFFTMPVLHGCSAFASKTQSVPFYSDPLGAEVVVEGRVMGVTPLTLELPRGEEVPVMIKKDGYRTRITTLRSYPRAVGIVDMAFGCVLLLPLLGLLSDGAWQLSPPSLNVILEPQTKGESEIGK